MWPFVLSNLAFDHRLGRLLPSQLPKLVKTIPTADTILSVKNSFLLLKKNLPIKKKFKHSYNAAPAYWLCLAYF